MFSPAVKQQALVACARHCCVCHKFCAINIECHHIRSEADGGPDTIENCIPLCFNCHADVMHYNPDHPKGNKYTEGELVQHRDNWFRKVAAGPMYAADAEARQVDTALFGRIREKFTSGDLLTFFSNHDFGGSFSLDSLVAVQEFWDFSKEPWVEFLDERMESLFGNLRSSVREFLNATIDRIFAVSKDGRRVGIPDEWDHTPEGKNRFREAMETLNYSASQVANAFQSFVRDGRRILVTH